MAPPPPGGRHCRGHGQCWSPLPPAAAGARRWPRAASLSLPWSRCLQLEGAVPAALGKLASSVTVRLEPGRCLGLVRTASSSRASDRARLDSGGSTPAPGSAPRCGAVAHAGAPGASPGRGRPAAGPHWTRSEARLSEPRPGPGPQAAESLRAVRTVTRPGSPMHRLARTESGPRTVSMSESLAVPVRVAGPGPLDS